MLFDKQIKELAERKIEIRVYLESVKLPFNLKTNNENEAIFTIKDHIKKFKENDNKLTEGAILNLEQFKSLIFSITEEEFLNYGMVETFNDFDRSFQKDYLESDYIEETNSLIIYSNYRNYCKETNKEDLLKLWDIEIFRVQAKLYNTIIRRKIYDPRGGVLPTLTHRFKSALPIPNMLGKFKLFENSNDLKIEDDISIQLRSLGLNILESLSNFENYQVVSLEKPDPPNFTALFTIKEFVEILSRTGGSALINLRDSEITEYKNSVISLVTYLARKDLFKNFSRIYGKDYLNLYITKSFSSEDTSHSKKNISSLLSITSEDLEKYKNIYKERYDKEIEIEKYTDNITLKAYLSISNIYDKISYEDFKKLF